MKKRHSMPDDRSCQHIAGGSLTYHCEQKDFVQSQTNRRQLLVATSISFCLAVYCFYLGDEFGAALFGDEYYLLAQPCTTLVSTTSSKCVVLGKFVLQQFL